MFARNLQNAESYSQTLRPSDFTACSNVSFCCIRNFQMGSIRGSKGQQNKRLVGCFCMCWVSYWAFIVYYWFEMSHECLGMVSNIISGSFGNCQISINHGPWPPYLLQNTKQKTRTYHSMFSIILILEIRISRLFKVLESEFPTTFRFGFCYFCNFNTLEL